MQFKRIICALLLVCMAAACLPELQPGAEATSPYYIEVDLTNQIVTVYDQGKVSDAGIVRQMICSSGRPGMGTPKGTFTLPKKSRAAERAEWYYFPEHHCYAKWATRIRGGILFHSVLYNSKQGKPTAVSVNALGKKASHGCVRLKVEDARWIAKNCPAGTKVRIFDGKKNNSLHKKVLKKTFSRDDQSYDSFLGRANTDPNVLCKGSYNENVGNLQNRLKALGYYGGSIDNRFGSATEAALKNFQAACGVSKTGSLKIGGDVWNRLFAGDAPVGTYVTLSKGMQGPAVQALQQALKDLKMYDGAAEGAFDADTVAAVQRYQRSFGFTVNGKAASSLQEDARKRAASLKEQFGSAEYQLVERTDPVLMAKVKPKTLYMRKKASNGARSVKKLKKNKSVRVLEKGKKWVKVQSGKKIGYVLKKHLRFYDSTETVLVYEEVAPTPAVTPFIPEFGPEFEPEPTPAIAAPPMEAGEALLAVDAPEEDAPETMDGLVIEYDDVEEPEEEAGFEIELEDDED